MDGRERRSLRSPSGRLTAEQLLGVCDNQFDGDVGIREFLATGTIHGPGAYAQIFPQ